MTDVFDVEKYESKYIYLDPSQQDSFDGRFDGKKCGCKWHSSMFKDKAIRKMK